MIGQTLNETLPSPARIYGIKGLSNAGTLQNVVKDYDHCTGLNKDNLFPAYISWLSRRSHCCEHGHIIVASPKIDQGDMSRSSYRMVVNKFRIAPLLILSCSARMLDYVIITF